MENVNIWGRKQQNREEKLHLWVGRFMMNTLHRTILKKFFGYIFPPLSLQTDFSEFPVKFSAWWTKCWKFDRTLSFFFLGSIHFYNDWNRPWLWRCIGFRQATQRVHGATQIGVNEWMNECTVLYLLKRDLYMGKIYMLIKITNKNTQ